MNAYSTMNDPFIFGYAVGSQANANIIRETKKAAKDKQRVIMSLKMRLFKTEEELKKSRINEGGAELIASISNTALIDQCAKGRIIITDTSSDTIENRHIWIWLNKSDFTINYPVSYQHTFYIKYFRNLWYNPEALGGPNGFYYLDSSNPDLEFIIPIKRSKEGKSYEIEVPHYGEHKMEGEKYGKSNLHLLDVELIFNQKYPKNDLYHYYKTESKIFTEVIVMPGSNVIGTNMKFIIGPNDNNLLKFKEMFFGEILPSNIHFVVPNTI